MKGTGIQNLTKGKILLSVGQTGFTDYCYRFGSEIVQKKGINSKPTAATVEKQRCPRGDLSR